MRPLNTSKWRATSRAEAIEIGELPAGSFDGGKVGDVGRLRVREGHGRREVWGDVGRFGEVAYLPAEEIEARGVLRSARKVISVALDARVVVHRTWGQHGRLRR